MVATGRSDYPNQINNVLAFPGVFRGLLDAQCRTINDGHAARRGPRPGRRGLGRRARPELHRPVGLPPGRGLSVAAAVPPPHGGRPARLAPLIAAAPLISRDDGHMDEMATDSLTGRLLVATPVLADPNFRRTVILVVEHEAAEGTLGVVLNRPTDVPVDRVLDAWSELVTGPSVVFKGGPVAPNSALAIGSVAGRRRAARLARAGRRGGHLPARAGRPGRAAGPARPGHQPAARVRGLRGLGARPAQRRDRRRRLVRGARRARGRVRRPSPRICGPQCCAGRAVRWLSRPRSPTTRA